MDASTDKSFLLVDEVAAALTVDVRTVYRLISRSDLPAYRFGRAMRVKRTDLARYIAHSKIKFVGRPLKRFATDIASEDAETSTPPLS